MSLLKKLKHQGRELSHRALDSHVRLGVTGLSGAGKTAFITSLVHQLTSGAKSTHLPFFDVMREGRYLGGRLAKQILQIPRFPYEQNLQYLQKNPPMWPPSTTSWGQLNLTLRYQSTSVLRSYVQRYSELDVDIVDYPGEWLLDLPMLDMDYRTWCEFSWQLFEQNHRQAQAKAFKACLENANLADASELTLASLTSDYKTMLGDYHRVAGAYLNQPSRLLVPGSFDGSPMLQLFPLLPSQLNEQSALLSKLEQHYSSYCKHVIKPFYQEHFSKLDRQVILVDCLSALNAGYDALIELQQALRLILQSFNYGESSLLARLFKPQISKVLFVATKACHVTPEQHKSLTLLLQQLLHQPLKHSQYQAAITEAMSISSIKASKSGYVQVDNLPQPCISGVTLDNQTVTYFPGDVPSAMPDEALFAKHAFSFLALAPEPWREGQELAHIRMDHALQFLLGDKLK